MTENKQRLLVLFGNQLFPNALIDETEPHAVFMAESEAICRRYAAHRHKLVLVLSAMRSKADSLRESGHQVVYDTLESAPSKSFFSILDAHLEQSDYTELAHFEPESPPIAAKLQTLASKHDLRLHTHPSPMFLTSREDFAQYRASHKRLFMADFYRAQRKRMDLLMEPDGTPVGGKWSYDEDNRKKLPKGLVPPPLPQTEWTTHTADVVSLVDARFPEHPGKATAFWLPTTEAQAERALQAFLDERLSLFGDYEDALSSKHPYVFHSVLSPLMNIGLLTPQRVLHAALERAEASKVPINSLEGFVRQVAGCVSSCAASGTRSLPIIGRKTTGDTPQSSPTAGTTRRRESPRSTTPFAGPTSAGMAITSNGSWCSAT